MRQAAVTVFTTDVSQLYAEKLKLANPNDHVHPTRDHFPMSRSGRWCATATINVSTSSNGHSMPMLNAEELGVSSRNVDEAVKSNQPEIRRLLGVEGNFGEQLGLSKDWVVRIVKQVAITV